MSRTFAITLITLIGLLAFQVQASQPKKPLLVVIDPGHGGHDRGATYHHVEEAKLNLKLALKLEAALKTDPRFKTILTRRTDTFISLKKRAQIARENKADLFISLHANSYHDDSVKGAEFYFENQLPPGEEALMLANQENQNSENSGELTWPLEKPKNAEKLTAEVASILQDLQRNHRIKKSSLLARSLHKTWGGQKRSKKHSIKQAPFYLVREVNMPTSLIELGYLTNKKEARKLTRSKYQQSVISSLHEGLIKYKEFIDKPSVEHIH